MHNFFFKNFGYSAMNIYGARPWLPTQSSPALLRKLTVRSLDRLLIKGKPNPKLIKVCSFLDANQVC